MGVRSALSSRTLNRLLPWIAGLVLAIGVVAFIQSRTETKSQPERFTNQPARDVSKNPKTVPLAPEARRVAVQFIQTAVARKNLARAWKISGPSIKQGQSFREWMTGEIAVVPFDLDPGVKPPVKIDWSYPRDASLEVIMLPREGSGDKPQVFFLGLKKLGNRWVVDYWSPYAPPAVPEDVGG